MVITIDLFGSDGDVAAEPSQEQRVKVANDEADKRRDDALRRIDKETQLQLIII